jgi:predicted dehydrogenase
MLDAAGASGRMLMVAHVVRFFPQFAFVKSLVDSGKYGKLIGLHLKRVIAKPDWASSAASLKTKGGPLIDLHIHDVDFLLYLLGRPKRLFAAGRDVDGMITYAATTYDYGDGLIASCTSGIASTKGRKFQHHFEAYFEQATVTHARATEPKDVDPALHQSASQALTVYHADGSVEFPDVGQTDGFAPQLAHAADCIAAGRASDIIDARFGREALELVFEEAGSIRSGQIVELT